MRRMFGSRLLTPRFRVRMTPARMKSEAESGTTNGPGLAPTSHYISRAFHPDWKLMDRPPTPPQTAGVRTARAGIATNAGSLVMFIPGNVHGIPLVRPPIATHAAPC